MRFYILVAACMAVPVVFMWCAARIDRLRAAADAERNLEAWRDMSMMAHPSQQCPDYVPGEWTR